MMEMEAQYDGMGPPPEWYQYGEEALIDFEDEEFLELGEDVMHGAGMDYYSRPRASITNDPRLFKVMDNICPEKCDLFSLTNIAWAFAKLILYPAPLLDAIASESRAKLSEMSAGTMPPQALAMPLWAFARLKFRHMPCINALSAAAINRIGDFSSSTLTNMAWSLAELV